MIGQIKTGSNFGGLFRYLLSPDKGARIIGGNVAGETAFELTQEFANCADQRRTTTKPVKHLIISFAPEDGVVSDEVKAQIAQQAVKDLGYSQNQYVVIDHHRDDPGHHWQHNHDHFHIAVNMVTLSGERINDWQDKRRFEASLRKLEIEHDLTPVAPSSQRIRKAPSTGQVQRYKHEEKLYKEGRLAEPPQPIVRTKLQKLIEAASRNKPTMIEFVARLRNLGVSVQTKITRNNVVQGISYGLDGVSFRGYRLHNSSFPKLQKIRQIDFDPQRDLAALRAFNSESDRGVNFAATPGDATTSSDSHLTPGDATNSKISHLSPRTVTKTSVSHLSGREAIDNFGSLSSTVEAHRAADLFEIGNSDPPSSAVNTTISSKKHDSTGDSVTQRKSQQRAGTANNTHSLHSTTIETVPQRNPSSPVVDSQFLRGLNTSGQFLFSRSSLGSELLKLGIKRYNLYGDQQKKPIKPEAWLVEGETYSLLYDLEQLEFSISHRDRGEILKAKSNCDKTKFIINSVELSDLKSFHYYLRQEKERRKIREKEQFRKLDNQGR